LEGGDCIAALYAVFARDRIVVGRDEDRGNRGAGGGQPLLKVEAAHTSQVDIQHEAGHRSR